MGREEFQLKKTWVKGIGNAKRIGNSEKIILRQTFLFTCSFFWGGALTQFLSMRLDSILSIFPVSVCGGGFTMKSGKPRN